MKSQNVDELMTPHPKKKKKKKKTTDKAPSLRSWNFIIFFPAISTKVFP